MKINYENGRTEIYRQKNNRSQCKTPVLLKRLKKRKNVKEVKNAFFFKKKSDTNKSENSFENHRNIKEKT